MSNSTTRLALTLPLGTDSPSALRTSITNNANITDASVVITEGTISARPAAGTYGKAYLATDVNQGFYLDNGSSWIPVGFQVATTSTSVTAVNGQLVVVKGSSAVTITLPAHVAGQQVAIVNAATQAATVSGTNILGSGLSFASSFMLGASTNSYVTLVDDGVNWYVTAGQQDSGWVAIPLASNWSVTAGAYTPSYRVLGSQVLLSGAATNGTGGSSTTPFTSPLPAAMRPASKASPIISDVTSGTCGPLTIAAAGTYSGGVGTSNGDSVSIDGASYRLS